MKLTKKQPMFFMIILLVIVTLFLIGLTYAYYRTRIVGNQSQKPSISATTKYLEIKFQNGNSSVNMEGVIEPGFEYTKTFSVENTGDDEVTYALYLEDVINTYTRTSDWEMEITCSPNCNGTDGIVEYPKLSEMITENTIPSGVTQIYNAKINYKKTGEDQSVDMGATLTGKFQIYSPENTVDIEGTIAGAEDGDYVQINSVPKKSQIVDGKYKLPAVEVGTHTLRVLKQDGTEKSSTTLKIESGNKNISNKTVTIDEKSATITLNISNISNTLSISIENIKENGKGWANAKENTLLYALKNNQPKGTIETIPGHEISNENEARVVKTTDDYGVSYVYRGNVLNNYVNYSGMCWRVLRVQGDGTIKLILADENGECNSETYTTDIFINSDPEQLQLNNTALINNGEGYSFSSEDGEQGFNYKSGNIPNILNDWVNKKITDEEGNTIREKNLDTSKLTETSFCNDLRIASKTTINTNCSGGRPNICTYKTFYNFKAYERLQNSSPTLECNLNQRVQSNIGILTADEAAFAGGVFAKENSTNYLSYNATSTYFTMSPREYIEEHQDSSHNGELYRREWEKYLITIDSFGKISQNFPANELAIRPVVVLKNTVLATTDSESEYEAGTYQNPYIIN